MRALLADAAENRADEADFATRPGPRTCAYCSFREVCPDRQSG
jgi:CRISPR/Cas system-associated exonuclease Cas4 (RecB family)